MDGVDWPQIKATIVIRLQSHDGVVTHYTQEVSIEAQGLQTPVPVHI